MQATNQAFLTHPGAIISVRKGPFTHLGILAAVGTVITNSWKRGQVVEVSIQQFAAGQDICLHGYWGTLCPWEIENRARSMLGWRYNVVTFNCEHFVRAAQGVEPVSKQVSMVVMAALGLFVLASAMRA